MILSQKSILEGVALILYQIELINEGTLQGNRITYSMDRRISKSRKDKADNRSY